MNIKNHEEIIKDINKLEGIFSDNLPKIIEHNKNFFEIMQNINNIENEDKKQELYDKLVKKIKTDIINNLDTQSKDDIKRTITYIRNRMIENNVLTEKILLENDFNFENIINNNQGIDTNEEIIDENESIEEINKTEIPEETKEPEPIEEDIKEIEKIEEQISKIEKNLFNTYTIDILIDTYTTELKKIGEEIIELEKEKNNEKLEIKRNYFSNLEYAVNTLKQYDDLLTDDELKEVINDKQLKRIIINKIPDKIEEQITKLNNEISLLKEENEKIEDSITEINENTKENEEEYKEKNLETLKQELKILNIKKEKIWPDSNVNLNIEQRSIDSLFDAKEIQEEIDKLKKEIEKRTLENQKTTNEKRIDSLTKEITKHDDNKEQLTKLNNLSFIKSTYYYIYKDAKFEFKEYKKYKKLPESINKFLNNHMRIEKLNKYPKSEKLKEELESDIINSIKPQVIEKAEKNKKLLTKALAGTAGFALGLGLSTVSVIGTIRLGLTAISVAKLATSVIIKIYSKKHPDKTIISVKNLENKYPKLKETADSVREFLKKPVVNDLIKTTNYFLNGVALGYTIGNLIEFGKNIIENIQEGMNATDLGIGEEIPKVEETPLPEKPTLPERVPIIDEVPTVSEPIIPKTGEVFDLSSITEGFTRADAQLPVDIMESLGKEVAFDKAVELPNGKIMWHFKRLNGSGYAWFDSEVVQEVLSKAQENISRTIR